MSDPVVDFHAHFLPSRILEVSGRKGEWHGTTLDRDSLNRPVLVTQGKPKVMGSDRYWESPATRQQRMADVGVHKQVLSVAPILYRYRIDPSSAITAAHEVNDEIAQLAEEWPDNYTGFAILPLQHIDASVAELERATRDLGLVGISVGTHVAGENWNSERLFPVLQAAEELGALIFFHPTDQRVQGTVSEFHLGNMIGNPFESTVTAASLIFGGVLDRLPDLEILLAHGGGFCCANIGRFNHGYRVRTDASAVAERLPGDYMTALNYDCMSHDGRSLRYLIDIAGIDRVVLGTDYPADMGLADPVRWIADCEELSGEERSMILAGNAPRLLGRK